MQNRKLEAPHSLPNRLASLLREEIVAGRLKPGERLPTETALGKKHGISRNAVREAIAQLRSAGIIETQQGRGSFVSETSSPALALFASKQGLYNLIELAKIFEFRAEIEAGAAALAAVNRSPAQLRVLAKALEDLERAIAEDRSGTSADIAFHRRLAEATGNRYFVDFMDAFHAAVSASIEIARKHSATQENWPNRVQAEHRAIYEALDQGDAGQAAAAMRRHIENAARRLGIKAKLTKATD